ncbi:aminotransferase class IV family protein [Cognatishimia sp. SS12]|uniref:aminotransferase class IV family protein n=1 Tax=Cognatishimia sp. SS12 TaxID=2979465 RepID=UPI00232C3DAE|nr:aminotransferase class IV family protein [Cognatishimia sp. SS12]MDC0738172.1 aminotransferase class IV family protein [Cognatishimia sp. SS12]
MESALRGQVPSDTQLIETFGWDPTRGFRNLDLHLARMAHSAKALDFAYDEARALYEIDVSGDAPLRCRLTLGDEGFGFTSAPLTAVTGPWHIAIADMRLASADPWLAHKSTQRALYDAARSALPKGVDELLFLNERDELCEGTITNLFLTRADGQMVTPPLSSGLLPGVLRQRLIHEGRVQEQVLGREDLHSAREIHVGNSLRGLIKSTLHP